jgi:hypothetical protein
MRPCNCPTCRAAGRGAFGCGRVGGWGSVFCDQTHGSLDPAAYPSLNASSGWEAVFASLRRPLADAQVSDPTGG